MTNENKLEKFNYAVDDLIEAKFILADVKIGKLISIMAEDDEIYHLLAKVLNGFDFNAQSSKYFLGDLIELPQKPRDLVAFVFSLLVAIHEKQFSFYDFLHQYFLSDNINNSYAQFVSKIIVPFKQVIVETLVGEGEKDLGPAPKTEAEILFDLCVELQNDCQSFKGCENCFIILTAMEDALRRGNAELFKALELSLYFSTKNKKFIKFAKDKFSVIK